MSQHDIVTDYIENTSKTDLLTISKIAGRAANLRPAFDRITLEMDLCVVHRRIPLRLDDMLEGAEFDLMHDVAGIDRHLNRDTGELGGCFLPRFAQ